MGDFLTANDTWFRPIDCLTGPDGALYVADWYDKRANHVDPVDTWDRSNGRIYKIQTKGAKPSLAIDPPLGKRSSKELIALLDNPNSWLVGEARRILMERRDASVCPELRKMVLENKGKLALESLWALYVSGGFDEDFAAKLLDHPNEDVRTWAIRLIADGKKVSPSFRDRLVALARTEKSATVRCQLACSAKRLPGPDCLAIVRELLGAMRTPTIRSSRCSCGGPSRTRRSPTVTRRSACSTRRRHGGRRSSDGSSWSGWPAATSMRAATRT